MFKYPKIYRWGKGEVKQLCNYPHDEVIIEEKVDGGNGSLFFHEEDQQWHVCSRNRDLIAEGDKKTFSGCRLVLQQLLANAAEKAEYPNKNFIYYFEWMQKHTINYDITTPKIIGFDIRIRDGLNDNLGIFLNRERKEKEFARLGIPVIPLVARVPLKDILEIDVQTLIPKSQYYAGKAEGIVIKNYNRCFDKVGQIFTKIVTEQFKEANQHALRKTHQDKCNDTQKILDVYATPARIRKHLKKLVLEEGKILDRSLMKYLPRAVIIDILKEEFLDIFDSYKNLNFKDMKRLISKPCLIIIDEELAERKK